jgi:energy-coupling factor transporter ATP-binding protein EcfA2
MSRHELDRVTKRYRSAQRERTVLREVDLRLEAGQLAIVWGARRSGRSTLLRIAAGVQPPDDGSVRLQGRPLTEGALGTGIGYVARTLRDREEQGVLDEVAAVLLARGVGVHEARERARGALARTGGERFTELTISELSGGETVRVAIARAIALAPVLLVIDEPAAWVEISERDEVLALLRKLSGDGLGVLASTGEAEQLAGADIALTLRDGQLHGQSHEENATVLPLRRGA